MIAGSAQEVVAHVTVWPTHAPAAVLATPAGELAIKCSSEELKPIALQALERLAMMLQVRVSGSC